MKKGRSNLRRAIQTGFLCFCLGLATLAGNASAQGDEPGSTLDIDITLPRVRVKPPVSEPTLKLFESLPARSFFSIDAEPSLRLETNPYQAPTGASPFRNDTEAWRIQTGATMGYAITERTRISANYFMIGDYYDDFTPYSLDSTVQTVGLTLEHDIAYGKTWLLKGAATARQVFVKDANNSGNVIPSVTLIKSINPNMWAYANSGLVLGKRNFVIGEFETMSPLFTVGTGFRVPYDAQSKWLKYLGGTQVNLSTTYAFTWVFDPAVNTPGIYHNMIVTSEVSKPIKRNVPVDVFVRAEPVFNFGQDHDTIGLSGINFRLFGGLRLSLSKPAIFTAKLDEGGLE